MRVLIATVNIIDEANASNEQISKKLLKMYEQIYTEVKSICTVQLPEKLTPVFNECEKHLHNSSENCAAELTNHKSEIEKAAEGCQMKFDVNESRRIVDNLHAAIQEGQHVEDTFANKVFKTYSTVQSNGLQMIDAIQIDVQKKRSLLADNNCVEQLKRDLKAKTTTASIQNIQGVDLMNGIRSSAEHFTENTDECMRQCGKDLCEFRENGFRAYEPSGGTPMKRDYRTNVRLTATEPHELIKTEIRRKIDEGMALECSIVDK